MNYKEEQEKKRQIQREHVKEVTGLLDTALSVIFAGHSDIWDEWTKHSQALHDERLMVKEFADSDFSAYNEEYAEFRYNTLLKNFKTILAHAKNHLDTVLKNRAAVEKARKNAAQEEPAETPVVYTVTGKRSQEETPAPVIDKSASAIFARLPGIDENARYTVKTWKFWRQRICTNTAYFAGTYHETNGPAIEEQIRELKRKEPYKAACLRALYEITRVVFYNIGEERSAGACFGFYPFEQVTQEEQEAQDKIMDVYNVCYNNAKRAILGA